MLKASTEEVAEKVLKEAGEEVIEKSTIEAIEEVTEKAVKEIGEESVEKVAKEASEEVAEKVFKETSEVLAEKEILEETVENAEIRIQKGLQEDTSELFTQKEANEEIDTDTTTAVQNTITEEIISQPREQVSAENTKHVLKEVTEGKVTKLPKDIAENLTTEGANELAEKISEELGGKKVWVSAKTGSVYVSNPPAEGFLLAEQLSKIDLTNTEEVEKILHRVAELTSRGSGDHVVLGPFKPNGTFIQEALDTDGVFWDVGDELWEALDKSGIDMFRANDQFLRVQIENRIDRFDVVNTNVNKVINDFNSSTPTDWTKIKYTEKEILDLASMPNIPYKLVDNSWVRVDLINNMH